MSGVRKIAFGAIELARASRPLEPRPVAAPIVAEPPVAGREDTYKQAYLEGFAAGEEDGRKEAQRRASESLKRLEEALAEAETAKQRWKDGLSEAAGQFARTAQQQGEVLEQLAANVAEIAVRRIVGRLHAEHRAVEAVCRETLRALHLESAQVRVCPSDCHAFAELPPGIDLVADASLEPGDCVLRSPQGDIEAGLATQLNRLRETLAAVAMEDGT
jgi:flagellar biosynthesis/type III secretory pathway protein FliH